ncbi:MAG: chemotaxis protein CheW [Bdellovibrionales bacterium]|nr:chemotaxis protein CheW [Bdellovibrionales bacterium]
MSQDAILRFLVFSLGKESYAIPLLSLKEVIAMPDTTPIPHAPAHFLGIMNLRGQVISVMDLRTKFGIKADSSGETSVIICDLAPLSIGVVVNSVDCVLALQQSEIRPRPDVQGARYAEAITGVAQRGAQLILILNIAKALDVEDLVSIEKMGQINKAA